MDEKSRSAASLYHQQMLTAQSALESVEAQFRAACEQLKLSDAQSAALRKEIGTVFFFVVVLCMSLCGDLIDRCVVCCNE